MANFLNRFRASDSQKEFSKSGQAHEKTELSSKSSVKIFSSSWSQFRRIQDWKSRFGRSLLVIGDVVESCRRFVGGCFRKKLKSTGEAEKSESAFRVEAYWEHELPESIEKALSETAQRIRREEIRKTLCLLTIVSLLCLWLAVLTEHWILTRGIPVGIRVVLVLAIVFFWLGTFWMRIFPFFRWKLHPFYLAFVIEQARPELKNGLLNLLFLLRKERLVQKGAVQKESTQGGTVQNESILAEGGDAFQDREGETARRRASVLERRVLKLLEAQTARQVSGLGAVSSLSKRELRRWTLGAVCVAILFLSYAILAPKSSFRSIARTLFPWSGINAPTRVRIWDVRVPEFLYQGETLSVSAEIRGLKKGEKAVFLYSSEDRKYSDVPILMEHGKNEPVDGSRFEWNAKVLNVRQTLWCRIAAGDAVSREFQTTVVPPLRAEILDVSLEPPRYSGLPVVRQKAGDLRAIDGTTVNLSIQTSEPAKDVRLLLSRRGADGRVRKETTEFFPLDSSRQDETSFRTFVPLKLSEAENNAESENLTAEIVFTNREGIQNRPLTYRWKILADRKPEIRLIEGPEDETEIRESEAIRIFFEASDPDFGLRATAVSASWNGKRLQLPPLLNLPREKEGLKVPFQGDFTFRATDWGLEAGDEILWWIEAADTRRPNSNRTETRKRRLRIVGDEKIASRKSDVEKTLLKEQAAEQTEETESTEAAERTEEAEQNSGMNPGLNPEQTENEVKESSVKDSQATGETLAEEIASEETGGDSGDDAGDSDDGVGERGGNEAGNGENDGNGKEKSGSDGDSDGNSGMNSDGMDSEDESGATDGTQSSGASFAQSGEEGSEQTSEAPRDAQPKLAQEGFDPLSEREAIQEPKSSTKKGDEDGEDGAEGEESNSGDGVGRENGADEGDEGVSQNASEKTEESGRNGRQKTDSNGRKNDENRSADEGKESGKNGQRSENDGDVESGENSGETGESDEKMKGGQNGSGAQSKDPRLELEAEDDGDGGEARDEKKQTGKSHGGGAKTESDAPEDVGNAQSGTEDGADSEQELPEPVKEKETFDGGRLQDSDSKRQNRERIADGDSEDDSDGEFGGEGLSEELSEEEKAGLKPDPVNDPGEAMEEILKHAEKEMKSAGNRENPNSDSPNGDGSQTPTPQETPSSTLGEGKVELQKNRDEKSGVGGNDPNSLQDRKESEGGRSSNQDGSQRGNSGDRKSRGEMKPDNSVESGGSSERNRGGNRNGADEQSNQQGVGRDGSNTPDESGNPAGSGGEGPTGSRGGNGDPTESPTGAPDPENRSGQGSSVKSGERESQAFGSDSGAEESRRATDGGGSGMGDRAHGLTGREGSVHGSQKEDAANLNFAHEQTVLALNHLRDALDKDDDSLLGYLGWTREEARRFLQEWEKLQNALNDENAPLDERRKAENRFRSLGLVPRSFRYRERIATEENRPAVRGGRRLEPPSAWRELFEAYSRGVGEGN